MAPTPRCGGPTGSMVSRSRSRSNGLVGTVSRPSAGCGRRPRSSPSWTCPTSSGSSTWWPTVVTSPSSWTWPAAARSTSCWHGRDGSAAGEVVAVVAPLALALGAGHRRGVLHGDIKPSNILFGDRGEPLLADFGVSRPVAPVDGDLEGSAPYLDPQLLATGRADPTNDVYALGVVSYVALTGRLPHDGATDQRDPRRGGEGSPPAVARGPGRPAPARRGHRGRAGPRSGGAAPERRVLRRHPPGGRRTRFGRAPGHAVPRRPRRAASARGRRRHAELRAPAGPPGPHAHAVGPPGRDHRRAGRGRGPRGGGRRRGQGRWR